MERVRCQFTDLEHLPDQLFACLSDWVEVGGEGPDADTGEALLQAQVALYEWMANLVQHADFGGRGPLVLMELERSDAGVGCTIEDNSDGFDFAGHLARRRDELNPMPERGMGLLLLYSTASEVRYERLGPHHHRLTFHIPAHADGPGLDLTASSDHA